MPRIDTVKDIPGHSIPEQDSGSEMGFPSDPNQELGFEIEAVEDYWSFVPEYYPDRFTQSKKKELQRYAGGCDGESVSIKSVKNREYHVTGVILQSNISTFHDLMEHDGVVDLLSPLNPNGGMRCFVKNSEIGKQQGWNPNFQQWMFKYTIDLVSTGQDERDGDDNAIVTALLSDG